MSDLTRREFTAMAVAVAAAPFAVRQPAVPGSALPVQALLDRIKEHIGVDWRAETVDGLKAGDPAMPVRGIATTALATLAVIISVYVINAANAFTVHDERLQAESLTRAALEL